MIGTVEQIGFAFSERFRQEMIRWLERMDSNGVFRDADSAAEGMATRSKYKQSIGRMGSPNANHDWTGTFFSHGIEHRLDTLIADQSPGICQASEDVFLFQPRVALEQRFHGGAGREHAQHVFDSKDACRE
jgi:hypothetical protein